MSACLQDIGSVALCICGLQNNFPPGAVDVTCGSDNEQVNTAGPEKESAKTGPTAILKVVFLRKLGLTAGNNGTT